MKNLVRNTTLAVAVVFSLAASPSLYAAQCFLQYADAVDACSNLPTFSERSICGLDAGLELAGCVRRTITG